MVKKNDGKDALPDGRSEEPLWKSMSGNYPWLPRPKKRKSLWRWGVVGGATALLALTIGLSKDYLPELFNKFSASYQTRPVEQVVREPSPSQKIVEPPVRTPNLKPVPGDNKIVGLPKSTPSIVTKPRSKTTLENRVSKNPRLARLLGFEKGLNEEFRKVGSDYLTYDSPVLYNAVVGIAEDHTHENELHAEFKKAPGIGENYDVKVLNYKIFEGDHPLVLVFRSRRVNNIISYVELKNGRATFSIDQLLGPGLDEDVTISIAELIYKGYNKRTDRELIGLYNKATEGPNDL